MFGLFKGYRLIGVCTFGQPPSPSLCKGLAGVENKHRVLELNRLWIMDETPKNTESWFVSRCLKQLRQLAPERYYIISYSDISQGHEGIIYRALSFLYLGLSDKHNKWIVEGTTYHSKSLANMGSKKFLMEKFGDRFKIVDRPRKHRYLFVNRKGNIRKKAIKAVKYKIHDKYPGPDR